MANKKPIDGKQVGKLAAMGCTQKEIAAFFECHPDTIRDRFSAEFTCARAEWKMSLRRAQTHRAVKDRSDTMLIHLGKTYLGQIPRELPPAQDDLMRELEELDNRGDEHNDAFPEQPHPKAPGAQQE